LNRKHTAEEEAASAIELDNLATALEQAERLDVGDVGPVLQQIVDVPLVCN